LRVPDAIFSHLRLAPVYDTFDGDRDDLDFYLSLADELRARTVLDVGCGTGCLAVRLAASGRSVVAVDPAEESLQVAKSKEHASKVRWIHGDAAVVPALGADLAVMTGNVAQVFLTDDEWGQTLRAIGRALRLGGYLSFETRCPERRVWQEWAADTGPVTMDVPGVGRVEQHREVTAVDPPIVSFRYTYRFESDGAEVVSDSTLRFRSRVEVESDLAANGYRVADVRDAPDRPGLEFMFVAERSM
jgi:SAM-dependent methyltransferase